MAFTIPNLASSGFAAQAEPDSVDFDALVAGIGETGVLWGCAVTAQGTPDMTVAVATGQVSASAGAITVSAGNVTITAADATNPRLDLIVASSSGVKSAVAGTAAASPVFPAIPAGSILLAAVYVPASDTAISTNQITDKRVFVKTPQVNSAANFGATGDDSTDNTTALQNWLNAGGISYLPPGIFQTGQLTVPDGAVIMGCNAGNYDQGNVNQAIPNGQRSCLKLKAAANTHVLYGPAGVSGVKIRDIEIDGNKTNQTTGTSRGIYLPDAGAAEEAQWHIERVYVHHVFTDGIYVGQFRLAVTIDQCVVYGCNNIGIVLNGTDNSVRRTINGLNGSQGIFIGADTQHIEGNDIFNNPIGINIYNNNVSNIEIIGNGLDTNDQQGIYVDANANAVAIIGNLFHSNSQASSGTYADIYVVSQTGSVNVVGNCFGALESGKPNKPSYCIQLAAGAVISQYANNMAAGHSVNGLMNEGMRNEGPDVGRQASVLKDPGAATATTYGMAAPTLTATATSSDDVDGPFVNHATATTNNSSSGMISLFTVTRRDWQPQLDCVVKTGANASDIASVRLQAGLYSASPDSGPTNIHSAFFRYDTASDGTAFWRTCTAAGGAPTVTTTTVAVAAATRYQLSLVCTSNAVIFYINRQLVAVHTATLPTSTTLLGYGIRVTNLAAGTARNFKWSRMNLSQV